jgi:hypothetical protein
MGYILVDDFTGRNQAKAYNNTFYELNFSDWDWEFNRKDKDKVMFISFTRDDIYNDSFIEIDLKKEYCIYCEDNFGKLYNYDYLIFSWKEYLVNLNNISFFGSPFNFNNKILMSLELLYNDKSLGEFLVFNNLNLESCDYKHFALDLSIFKSDFSVVKFNKIRIHILTNIGVFSKIYFGDIFLMQDYVEHNMVSSIVKELNFSHIEKCGTLLSQGKDYIILSDMYDIEDGYCIALSNSYNELSSFSRKIYGYNYLEYDTLEIVEIHQIKSIELTDLGYKLNFYNSFDGEKLLYNWASGTDVYFVVPCIMDNFIDESYKLPCILVTYNFPSVDTKTTNRHRKVFNIKVNRGSLDRPFEFGIIKSFNYLEMEILISVFSGNQDLSNKLTNKVRNKVDILDYIYIFDLKFDISDIKYSTLSVFDEYSPVSEFTIETYTLERLEPISYQNYLLKEAILDFGVIGGSN